MTKKRVVRSVKAAKRFTDADLKRLKGSHAILPELDWEEMRALVDRLEIAEDAVNQAYRCTPDNREYYVRWLKATGKWALAAYEKVRGMK